MSIFSNSNHLEWKAGLLGTIVKGTHPRTIPARLGVIWFSGFRGKNYDVRTDGQTDDDGHQVMAKAHVAFGQVS